jgi:aminopeptidase YwaD
VKRTPPASADAARALSARLLGGHLEALCTDIGPRMIGTKGDHDSARYVEEVFRYHGLDVISHAMPCVGWDLRSTVLSVDGRRFPAIGNMYSPAGRTAGTLVLSEPDIPDGDFRALKGKTVAVYGNFEPFPARLNAFALKAERAGAAAVVVIDTSHSTSSTKLVREAALKRMPVLSVSLETGYRLAKLEGRPAACAVDARRYPSRTRDVIGILPGGPREICIEAHRDSAPDTPAADDNGSGTVVLLELSRLLAAAPRRHAVRLVSATGEEFGNVGTPVYAKTFAKELRRIDLMINADCVGGRLCPLKVYVRKTDPVGALVKRTLAPYRSMRLVRTDGPYGSQIADHLGARVNVVNVICDWTNALIHTPKDVPANLSTAKLAEVAHFLRDLVLAYDREPRRTA